MSDETLTKQPSIETVAENAAATATADTATASPDVVAPAAGSGAAPDAGAESDEWRARMAAEDAAKAPAAHDHAGHDHSGHDHAGHDHSGHDHAGHAHAAPSATTVADKPAPWTGEKASAEDVEEAMKDVVDPELGINVVDLGLVYGVHVDDENVVTLDMTLTSAACPLTDVIEDQTRSALTTGPGGGLCNDFRINWVWLPPWGPDKITDEGRDQLRALGFNV
jgi:metal-sulfur cluster biosynthetic enzyme